MLICAPTYAIKTGLADKVKTSGKVIRCICIMDHHILGTGPKGKDGKEIPLPSVQIIIPQRQVNRKSDIYIMMVSSIHQVCKGGFYIAIISANVETSNPEKELDIAFSLIGTVKEKFITVSDVYTPVTDFKDGVFITKSLDPTSHFETATDDVLNLYKIITGKDLDLENLPEETEEQ